MPARWALPAMVVACLLLVTAPAVADEPTTDPSAPTSSTSPVEAPSTEPVAEPAPAPSVAEPAPSTSVAEMLDEPAPPTPGFPAFVDRPATVAGDTPTRGPQVQLATPPPGPFDPPANSGTGRRVVYSKSQQTVWAYDESNTIIKMHRVSGRQDPNDPTPGTYRVWSRSLRTFSINNPSITWGHMVRFAKGDNGGNIGFHDIPYQYGQPVQTTDQLGQALSGGCVRQSLDDAIWMWNWAHIGTVVVVTP